MKYLLTLILTIISVTVVFSQKPPQNECSLEFARTLVEQQAAESKNIEATNKRLKILTSVAEFLWKIDESTSRKYLSEAFELADSRFNERGREKKKTGGFSYQIDPDYRFEVINAIGKLDIDWAKKLTEKVLTDFEEADKSKRDGFDKESEIRDSLDFAVKLYDQNPQTSLVQIRRAMRYPLGQNWYYPLISLAKKNQQFADQIFSELLVNYANAPISDLFNISDYPFGTGSIINLNSSMSNDMDPSFMPNPNLQKQFLTLILQRATTYQPTEEEDVKEAWKYPDVAHLYHTLRTFEPIIQQKFPEMASNWANAKTQIYAYVGDKRKTQISESDKRNDERKTSFEKRLAQLEKDDELGKLKDDAIFWFIVSAKKEEQYAKAESWLDKIKDTKLKDSVTLLFYYHRTEKAISDKRFADARKFTGKIAKLEFRSMLLLKIAEAKLKEKLGKAETMDILLEVYQTAAKADNSAAKVQTFFGLALVYEKVDHANAINSLSEGIQTFNNLENAENVFADYLNIAIEGKNFGYSASLSTTSFRLETIFRELSKNDFNNTLNYANSFTDKYFRALAVIEVAKNCKDTPKPKVVKK
jgi:hypothetical protein